MQADLANPVLGNHGLELAKFMMERESTLFDSTCPNAQHRSFSYNSAAKAKRNHAATMINAPLEESF